MRIRIAYVALGLAVALVTGCSQLGGSTTDSSSGTPETAAAELAENSKAPGDQSGSAVEDVDGEVAAKIITMPSVTGTILQTSHDKLTELGFRDVLPEPVDGHAFAANYRNWVIVDQDPAAGEKVQANETVTLQVKKTDAAEKRSCLDLDC